VREVTASGQTVDEAIESALSQLNMTKEEVDIDIIDEGKKGFLGIFGSSRAVVKVREKKNEVEEVAETPSFAEEVAESDENNEDIIEEAKRYLIEVATNMGTSADVTVTKEEEHITFTLTGDKIGLLIGKRGRTLNALQYLTQLVINKEGRKYQSVTVDAAGYRERRKATLIDLAQKMAEKALHIDKKVSLEPMPAYERKIIHSALQDNDKVATYSEGKEPHRYIVIKRA